METILQNLKKLRKERHLNQDEVARSLGFKSRNGYWAIETGKTALKLEHIQALAKLYDLSAEMLMLNISEKMLPELCITRI